MYKGYNMKIYVLYITVPEDVFQKRLKYLINSCVDNLNYKLKDDNVVSLYAWTPKKKILKRFLEERCRDVFTIKEKEFDTDDEYYEFMNTNEDAKLRLVDIGIVPACDGYERDFNKTPVDGNHFVQMVVTKFESTNFGLYKSENMNEFGPRAYADMDYCIFNDELIAALKTLGYVTLYDSSYSQYFTNSDDRLRKYEEAMDVVNLLDMESDYITPLIMTEYVAFIYLYSYTFIGK